jgi:hypothetical protein
MGWRGSEGELIASKSAGPDFLKMGLSRPLFCLSLLSLVRITEKLNIQRESNLDRRSRNPGH